MCNLFPPEYKKIKKLSRCVTLWHTIKASSKTQNVYFLNYVLFSYAPLKNNFILCTRFFLFLFVFFLFVFFNFSFVHAYDAYPFLCNRRWFSKVTIPKGGKFILCVALLTFFLLSTKLELCFLFVSFLFVSCLNMPLVETIWYNTQTWGMKRNTLIIYRNFDWKFPVNTNSQLKGEET